MTLNGITYTFTTAPKHVQHAVRLITERYGATLTTANCPDFVRHRAKTLADRWGVAQ